MRSPAHFDVLTLMEKVPNCNGSTRANMTANRWFHSTRFTPAGFEVLTLMEKVPTDDEDRPLQVG